VVLATMAARVPVVVVPVGTAKAHCPSRPVVTPLRLVPAAVMHPSLVLSHQLVVAQVPMPSPATAIPALPVALVVVVPAAAPAALELAGKETLGATVRRQTATVVVVVVRVPPAIMEVYHRRWVAPAARVRRPRLRVGLLHEQVVVVVVASWRAAAGPVGRAAAATAATTSESLEVQTPAAVVVVGQAVAASAPPAALVVLVLLLSNIPRAP